MGYPDNKFRPNNTISYAEIVTILARLHPSFIETNKSVFENHWAEDYFEFGRNHNYFEGFNTITVDLPANREVSFEMIYNFLNSTNRIDKNINPQPKPDTKSNIKVINGVSIDEEIFRNKSLELVNNLRKSKGIEALKDDTILRKGAYIRAEEMVPLIEKGLKQSIHLRPDGSLYITAFDYVQNEGDIFINSLAENANVVQINTSSNISIKERSEKIAQDMFNFWVSSELHHSNMVNPNLNLFDIGIAYIPSSSGAIRAVGMQMIGNADEDNIPTLTFDSVEEMEKFFESIGYSY